MDYILIWFLLGFVLTLAYLALRIRKITRPWINKKFFLLLGIMLGLLQQMLWAVFFLNMPFMGMLITAGVALSLTLGTYFSIGFFKREKARLILTAIVCCFLFVGSVFLVRLFTVEYQRKSTPKSCDARSWPNLFYSTSAIYAAFYKTPTAPCLHTMQ
jgi:hypothetical protein